MTKAETTQTVASAEAPGEMYYIQDTRSYVGNSVLWWAVDGAGYTCDIDKAWKVTRQEADRIARSRGTDKPWPASLAEAAITRHVDMQRLRSPIAETSS